MMAASTSASASERTRQVSDVMWGTVGRITLRMLQGWIGVLGHAARVPSEPRTVSRHNVPSAMAPSTTAAKTLSARQDFDSDYSNKECAMYSYVYIPS
jgi:hypothetical protein